MVNTSRQLLVPSERVSSMMILIVFHLIAVAIGCEKEADYYKLYAHTSNASGKGAELLLPKEGRIKLR